MQGFAEVDTFSDKEIQLVMSNRFGIFVNFCDKVIISKRTYPQRSLESAE